MEVEAIEKLKDLRDLVDSTIGFLESDPPMFQGNTEPMAYDFVLGGRFGIVDLKKGRR
jgi:hypothetical protein